MEDSPTVQTLVKIAEEAMSKVAISNDYIFRAGFADVNRILGKAKNLATSEEVVKQVEPKIKSIAEHVKALQAKNKR